MQLLITQSLALVVTILAGVHEARVCMTTETYQERTQVTRPRPREVTKVERCWNPLKFFSCKRKVIIWEEHVEYVMVPKSRLVSKCCNGYVKVPGNGKCVPHCERGCGFGICMAPDDCWCHPGYRGAHCEYECPEGYWGQNCALECKCSKGGRCNNIVGCVCHSGWMGYRCELPCEEGYYGTLCRNKCSCDGNRCDHITGDCLTTTGEPFTTTEKYEISTGETTQYLSTLAESSTEVIHSTEWSSTTEVFESLIGSDKKIHEINGTTTVTANEMEISEFDDFDSAKNTVLTESTAGTEAVGVEFTPVREKEEKEMKHSETVPQEELESTNNQGTESSTLFPLGTVNEPDIGKNEKSWISHTASKGDADNNKTDNFIFEGNGNSGKGTIFKLLHFLPSLSVISAASFLIIIIAARWVIVNHRRKTRMLVVVASEKGNIYQSEDGAKFQAENLFWVNNCTVNPVYMSDVDLNNPAPVLQTFKPVDKEMARKERTVL